ncbi:hypothetical protein [Pseudanabaena sp. ABRG5-3]|jgi:hypothetical protein|uniref:hypothetical protein n=1 Tax=Pseudanabaena sp. ABRG5-3 TaxID=685565 RepID=UPI000DC72E01|nr:hypothetical protein [Pseudanabaena sp. ABRG5-3]BBC26850.1 hypothetical protein ABRG53_c011 [Pseudanabaena sp. ABRG5-3]
MKLGTILVRKKLISQAQLDQDLNLVDVTGKRLGELLLDKGEISDSQLKDALNEQYWRKNGFWIID